MLHKLLYQAVVLPELAETCGYSEREMHAALLVHFYGASVHEPRTDQDYRAHIQRAFAFGEWLGLPMLELLGP